MAVVLIRLGAFGAAYLLMVSGPLNALKSIGLCGR